MLVALPHEGTGRVPRGELGKDHLVGGRGVARFHGRKARQARRQHMAAFLVVCRHRVGPFLELHDLDRQLEAGEIVDHALFVARVRHHAHARTRKFERARHAMRAPHEKTLPVVHQGLGEADAVSGIAARREVGVARQHIDGARLQCAEAFLRPQRDKRDRVPLADGRERQRPAEIDGEPGPVALRVPRGVAADAFADPAHDAAPLARGLEDAGVRRTGNQRAEHREHEHGGGRRVSQWRSSVKAQWTVRQSRLI